MVIGGYVTRKMVPLGLPGRQDSMKDKILAFQADMIIGFLCHLFQNSNGK